MSNQTSISSVEEEQSFLPKKRRCNDGSNASSIFDNATPNK